MFIGTAARPVIFIHNPRAAGTSVVRAFGKVEVKDVARANPQDAKSYTKHCPLSMVLERLDYPSLGVVRNPWARQYSLYLRFWCSRDWNNIGKLSFKQWLMGDKWLDVNPDTYSKLRRRPWLLDIQRRPQSWWLEGCSYTCRFEHLLADLSVVCSALSIKLPELPKLNTNNYTVPYQEAYNSEMIDFVGDYFLPDIDRWGYSFDN